MRWHLSIVARGVEGVWNLLYSNSSIAVVVYLNNIMGDLVKARVHNTSVCDTTTVEHQVLRIKLITAALAPVFPCLNFGLEEQPRRGVPDNRHG